MNERPPNDIAPYVKCEKVDLKSFYDEKWLQKQIQEDPSILGLGPLEVLSREKRQSSGGILDFLLHDSESDTMYEVEVMLGATDESHIIRCIEYWDIESRRYQSKEHIAVLVAEDITNRFFNVIHLMNRSIPIIAIQLDTLKVDGKLTLNFTTVLDTYEEPGDDITLETETKDRKYWEGNSNPRSLSIMDEIIKSLPSTPGEPPKVTYNKNHIALGTSMQNYALFRPRKTEGYCQMDIKVPRDKITEVKELLQNIGVNVNLKKSGKLSLVLLTDDYNKNKKSINELFNKLSEYY